MALQQKLNYVQSKKKCLVSQSHFSSQKKCSVVKVIGRLELSECMVGFVPW